jgi:hypothetical protein
MESSAYVFNRGKGPASASTMSIQEEEELAKRLFPSYFQYKNLWRRIDAVQEMRGKVSHFPLPFGIMLM